MNLATVQFNLPRVPERACTRRQRFHSTRGFFFLAGMSWFLRYCGGTVVGLVKHNAGACNHIKAGSLLTASRFIFTALPVTIPLAFLVYATAGAVFPL